MKKFLFFIIIISLYSCYSTEYNKGLKYFENKEYDKAKEIFLNIINEQEKYKKEQILESYSNLFIIYQYENNNQAEDLLKEAIDKYPDYNTFYSQLLNYYLKNGKKNKFLELYNIFHAENKSKTNLSYLGYVWYEIYLQRKYKLNSSSITPEEVFKKTFEISNELLVPFYLEILKINPLDKSAKYYLGINLVHIEKYEEAIDYLLESIENKINLKESYYNLGVSYFNLNMLDKAREAIIKAQELGFEVHPSFLSKLGLNK